MQLLLAEIPTNWGGCNASDLGEIIAIEVRDLGDARQQHGGLQLEGALRKDAFDAERDKLAQKLYLL